MLKKLNILSEQIKKELKECCDAGITADGAVGPDTAASSTANTYQTPPPHQHGQASVDTDDLKAMYVPCKNPYLKTNKRKKK